MTEQPPTPLIRADGWTSARQVRFLDRLARRGNVRAACAGVGMSREAAYRLRRREPLFARAWDAALVAAREASAEELACRAIDGVEEDVWYKGEHVGTKRKYDARLLLAHMARLDKFAEANTAACDDAGRFDELLAVLAGEEVPAEIAIDEAVPPARELTIGIAGEIAVDEWEDEPENRIDADCGAAIARARAEAAVRWDAWLARACGTVDRLLEAGADDAVDPVRTVSQVSTSPAGGRAEAVEAEEPDAVAVVAGVSPSPADVPVEALATPEDGKLEREPRYEDFARSPTSWRDYCEARKQYHQKELAEHGTSKQPAN